MVDIARHRVIAILGWISKDTSEMENAFIRLNRHASVDHKVIPLVIPDTSRNTALVGYARARWIIDVLKWTLKEHGNSPQAMVCVRGLLLGYSADEIEDYIARHYAGAPTS